MLCTYSTRFKTFYQPGFCFWISSQRPLLHKDFKLLPGQQPKFILRALQILLPLELEQQVTPSLLQFLPKTIKKYINQILFLHFVCCNQSSAESKLIKVFEKKTK